MEKRIGDYIIKKSATGYWCSCPAWKYMKVPVALRVCKHMRELGLGVLGSTMPIVFEKTPKVELVSDKPLPDDVAGYIASEKLDGVFVRITPDGKVLTRSGQVLNPPKSLLSKIPKEARKYNIDGELFAGRGHFSHVASIYNVHHKDDKTGLWDHIELRIFNIDAPGKFSERIKIAGKLAISIVILRDNAHLQKISEEFREKGAEGIIVRGEDEYKTGRNPRSWKHRLWTRRTESVARVSENRVTTTSGVAIPVRTSYRANQKITYLINGFSPSSGKGGKTQEQRKHRNRVE